MCVRVMVRRKGHGMVSGAEMGGWEIVCILANTGLESKVRQSGDFGRQMLAKVQQQHVRYVGAGASVGGHDCEQLQCNIGCVLVPRCTVHMRVSLARSPRRLTTWPLET